MKRNTFIKTLLAIPAAIVGVTKAKAERWTKDEIKEFEAHTIKWEYDVDDNFDPPKMKRSEKDFTLPDLVKPNNSNKMYMVVSYDHDGKTITYAKKGNDLEHFNIHLSEIDSFYVYPYVHDYKTGLTYQHRELTRLSVAQYLNQILLLTP